MIRTFTLLTLIVLSAFSLTAQTFNLGIVGDPAFGCTAACNPSVCSPSASGGQPVYETINSAAYLIPANSNVRVQITSVLCAAANLGPGLDLGDSVRINGETIIAPITANNDVNYDGCFSSGAVAQNLVVTLVANRRDETITVTLTVASGAGAGCDVLKIALLSFNAQRMTDGLVNLKWQTANEQNNDYMAVERSADGVNFTEVGRVSGSGTTSTARSFQLIDRNPLSGNAFYRLRSVDFEGHKSYSKTILVLGKKAGQKMQIYPNPVNNTMDISTAKNIERVVIMDNKGSIVMNETVQQVNTYRKDLSALSAGIYIVKIFTADEILVQKVIKQ